MTDSIGKRIKSLREKHGISQIDLAIMIDVSKQLMYKYENDIVTNIPSDKIENIAVALDTTPSFIMGWEGTEIEQKLFELLPSPDDRIFICEIISESIKKKLSPQDFLNEVSAKIREYSTSQKHYMCLLDAVHPTFSILERMTFDEDYRQRVDKAGHNYYLVDFIKELQDTDSLDIAKNITPFLSGTEIQIIKMYRDLNEEGQRNAGDYLHTLVLSGKYKHAKDGEEA